ncbi:MAG: dihydroneopterin aldolase [Rhodospirillaceae bacterium]|jgi:7,8-dihydroneopterin aldolase/epimerase/oxygenase|nr:dihydroneopterin aldolase [Rhodospirillaceae bacterium]
MGKPGASTPRIDPTADGRRGIRHVFVRDLELCCLIGVHSHERDRRQRVRINLDLAVEEGSEPIGDDLAHVVSYEDILDRARAIAGAGHINLVETLAERIAETCLEDTRVCSARIRVEKLDVFDDTESVGVEIERFNTLDRA